MSKPKSKKRNIHGWVVLDKPYGMTSTQAVGAVKYALGAKKAGHAGTLDPLATGLLPIALGEATKTVPIVQDGAKIYRFAVNWGKQTSTDDLEGDVIAKSDVRPDAVAIKAILPEFIGVIQQVPPTFSAIKVKGARAYDLARDGEKVELMARPIKIDALELIDMGDGFSWFEVTCGKGTYVRALVRDMAKRLGTYGHVRALVRWVVGPFSYKDRVQLTDICGPDPDNIERIPQRWADAASHIVPLEAALGEVAAFPICQDDAHKIRLGNAILMRGSGAPLKLDLAYVHEAGHALALGKVEKGQFKPKRVILPH